MGRREGDDVTGHRAARDVADAAALLLDGRGVVIGWPEAAERLFGYPAADMLGQSAATLLASDDATRVPELVERCQAQGGWSGVLSARHREGRPVAVEVRIVRLPEEAGRERWLALAEDTAPSAQWGMGPAVLERMVTQSPVGLAVVDTELRCVWSNTALERFGGGPVEERRGRRLAEIQPGLDTEVLEAQMRRVLETGVPAIDYEHVGRTRSDPHRERAHSMSFVRLEDDNGHALGVCYSVIDITDRYRARRRLALLDRASGRIGSSLDVMRTAQDLADVAVPDLADFVAVDLLESVIKGGEPVQGPLGDADLVRLLRGGQQSVRAGVPEAVVEVGGVAAYHAWSPPIRCLTSGRSWRAAQLDPLAREWATDIPGGRAVSFRELGFHTAMVVPIRARGVTMGVTTFFRAQRDEAFDEDDLRLAEEFVARAAVCLDNARRYTRERDAALVLQRSLLPHGAPPLQAVEVASCYRPADELSGLGGDWFDVIPLSGARVALVVGEAVGHGIEAAATMGQLRTAVRTLADLDLSPEELLAHLDDLVTQVAREAREGDAGRLSAGGAGGGAATGVIGSSCLYVAYDPVSRQCVMASAGHLAPAVVAPGGGSVDFPDVPLGPALGVGGLPFESVELTLEEGSVLALYTDGLVAAPEAGRDGLRRALAARELPLDQLSQSVMDELAPARPFDDDAALLLVRTRSLDVGQVASWDLPSDPAVVSRARKMATRRLGSWGLEELVFTTELVVSEMVTNAIRHASGPIRLRLILERNLICEVSDASSTSPHLRHPRTTDEGGRGLFLISQFTQRWGTRYTTDGKVIWAEQLLDHDESAPEDPLAAAAI